MFAWGARPAIAQPLPRLHVLTLGQHADRSVVAPHEPFHVTIRLTISEVRSSFDDLILGDCTNCAIVGDERIPRALRHGTEYVERLTLEANAPGEAQLSPAYIDAVDPASGRALRYSTDPVSVRVSGPSPLDTTARAAVAIFRAGVTIVGVAAAILVLLTLFVLRGRRHSPHAAEPIATPVAPPPPRATLIERLGRATEGFRRARSAAALVEVRGMLFEAAGVASGSTLVDALRALGERDRPLRFALLAAERATFGPAGERETASDELLAALEAYCRVASANEPAWTP